jgi:SpoVK/Ycf46/Vps4 family AAA+-type ATPase
VDDSVFTSLEASVEDHPDDLALRLHLAELYLADGREGDAIRHAAAALLRDPGSAPARDVMSRAVARAESPPESRPVTQSTDAEVVDADGGFDWSSAEGQLGDAVGPMFVDGAGGIEPPGPYEVSKTGLRLNDIGGMVDVKKRLESAFLAPMRNPELSKLYGKTARGGLLLYGPPGCGKTFLARAVAGELGAAFLAVSVADVLDMYMGNSEQNVHELFESARAAAPCLIFLDELDGIGQKRSLTRHSPIRTTVNQLLLELDGVATSNDGVFVLAATNHPWDVDPALRRPGRLDRTLLVLPPDREARESIFKFHLRERPIENIDLRWLAKNTDGYSGADIAHICNTATETALLHSVESGEVRMIGMADLKSALEEVRPSIGPWLETARNVALFANTSGEYDELAKYIRKRGLV